MKRFTNHGSPVTLLALAIFLPGLVLAHDTWLVPSSFHAAPGSKVRLRLATSEAFPTSDSPVGPERIARFTVSTKSGTRPVEGYRAEGNYLVADVGVEEAGHAVFVAETKPRVLVLQAKEFNDYLRHEEKKPVMDARREKGQTDSPGRERYRKIAKTILCVGKAGDKTYKKRLGLWLEVVPEKSTCKLRAGDNLTVRVFFEGRPLEGAHVAAGYEGVTGHQYPIWVRTPKSGRVGVTLDRPGPWFVRVLHMVPAKNDAEADWQSAFSTLTFEVMP